MAAQLRFIRWSLPAFALIIGIFWYKRRRVQRGDPGGKSIQSRDCDLRHSETKIQEETEPQPEPQTEIPPTSSPVEHSRSISNSRKSSDSLNQQVRRSPPQPIIFTESVVERHHRSADWYQSDDDDVIEQLNRTDPVLNKKSNRKAQMAAKKHCESPEQGSLEANAAAEENQLEVQVEPLEFKKEAIKDMEVAKEDKKEEAGEENKEEEKKEEKEFEPNDIRSQVEERDSANHSPVSGVLEGSVTDEVRSEGSTDSGKGGSIKGHVISSNQTYYDFLVPSSIVGRLIGRNGNSLHQIRSKSGARINIEKKMVTDDDCMVCVVEGTPEAIQIALVQIRKKFPINLYPNLTMEQLVKFEELSVPAPLTQLTLTEGVNNNVAVCSIVTPEHLFVQLATHPSFPALKELEQNMTQLYNTYDSPTVPLDLAKDQIVAVFLMDKWMRALIVVPDPSGVNTVIRLLDHGGYWSVGHAAMRQIRNDYLSLPFQAIEVFLANVKPTTPGWVREAYEVVKQTCTIVGQAQVIAYVGDKTYVNIFFSIPKHGLISLAEELVQRRFAELVPLEETIKDGLSEV